MKYDFWLILSVIFAIIFWFRFAGAAVSHLNYNSPGNFYRKIDNMYGKRKVFNVQNNLWIAIILSVFAYCRYNGGI